MERTGNGKIIIASLILKAFALKQNFGGAEVCFAFKKVLAGRIKSKIIVLCAHNVLPRGNAVNHLVVGHKGFP